MEIRSIKTYVLPLVIIATTQQGMSQELDFSNILRGGIEDIELYLDNYISPVMKGAGYGLTNGWYNTAKPHKPLGIDITANMSLAFVPDKDLFFNFSGFNTLTVESGPDQLPTIVGPSSNTNLLFSTTAEVTYTDPDPASPTFNQSVTAEQVISGNFPAPDGIDLEDKVNNTFVPVPMIQLGIGLIKKTELKLRFLPSISADDFKFNFFGIGVMHDFKQWTPGISHLPFDMSAFVGLTKLTAESELGNVDNLGGSGQVAGYDVNSLTFQVVASKKLSVLTIYGGLGYSSTTSKLKMKGTYVIDGTVDIELADGSTETVGGDFTRVDPVDLSFDSSGPRATIGARLKLLVLTLHADYTFQEYNTLTAGFGISIR